MQQGSTRFGFYGDSGSAVWNRRGEWVGLFFGGTSSVSQVVDSIGRPGMVTYITPAEDIVKHVEGQALKAKVEYKVGIYDPSSLYVMSRDILKSQQSG